MFIDTHAHYNLPAFDEDRDEVLARVRAAGVGKIICPAIAFDSNMQMMACLEARDDIFFAVGIHPKRVFPQAGAVRPARRAGHPTPESARAPLRGAGTID